MICDQQGKSTREVWDGENLMLTFRRNVSENTMNLWFELCNVIEDISLSE